MTPHAITQSRPDTRRLVELLLVDGDLRRGIQSRKALASAEIAEGARERYHVTQVATLREALECLAVRRYDAVLLNLFVPDSLGLGTLHEVRRRAPDTPVIALGGLDHDTEQAAAVALEAGARDYLLAGQECEPAALARAVRGAIGEQGHAEANRFMRDASEALSAALDIDDAVHALCGLAISRLAGCCIVDVRSSGGPVTRMGVAHSSSEWTERLASLAGTYPMKSDLSHPVIRVLFTGREELIEQTPAGWARSLAYREEDIALLDELGVRSAMLLPLKARGRTVGVLTLLGTQPPAFTPADMDMAARLAMPAGFAIDNALLMQQAGEAVRERRDIMASASHDLRTPLTSIRAGLGLLGMRIEDRLTEDERDLLANVHRNVVRLGDMLNQLLTQNQMETGPLELLTEPVNLAEVARQAAEAARVWTLEKGQKLRVQLPAVIPCEGDASHLERVVLLLLDNTYRHTPPGTAITLSGRTSGGNIVLAVHDTGPGIPHEEQEAIFRRFHRGSSGAKGPGLGLGLAMARSIVEAHGGRLSVDSAPGAGTTFYITLPTHTPRDQGSTKRR
jgi:signal transduction histidine kinase/ActR/RegA family two-component response regulator